MSHCGRGTVNPNAFMDPASILFTQNTISTTFSDGRSVEGAVHDLRSQGADPAVDVPIIRVVHSNGSYRSLDNRRLYTFKAANLRCVPVHIMPPTEEFYTKLQNQSGRAVVFV
jgi:filamentous hemagglutinin